LNKTAGQRASYGDFSDALDATGWIASRRDVEPEALWRQWVTKGRGRGMHSFEDRDE
jgi:hypothetical protein